MKKEERKKVFEVLARVESCQIQLNLATKSKDWYLVRAVSDYLNEVKNSLEDLRRS